MTLVESPPWESPQWQEAVRENPSLVPFFDNLESFVELPEGVEKLRTLVLDLAVSGRLILREKSEIDVESVVSKIVKARQQLITEKKVRKSKAVDELDHTEIPFVAPSGWAWTRFADLRLDAYTGLDRGKAHQSPELAFSYFKMNNMTANGQCDFAALTAIDATEDEVHKYSLQEGDFLFNTRNSAELVGKTCVFRHAPTPAMLFNNNILRIVFGDGVDSDFANLWFCSSFGRGLLDTRKSSTTNVAAIYQGKLMTLPFPLPPLAEQRRIVSKVEGLMSLCDTLESHRRARECVRERASRSVLASLTSAPAKAESNGAKVAKGETLQSSWQRLSDHFEVLLDQPSGPEHLRQSILQLAVQGKLVPQDPRDEPAGELLEGLLAKREELLEAGAIRKRKTLTEEQRGEPMFDAPDGWCWNYFENLADLTSGVTKGRKLGGRKTEAYPYLRVANVQRWFVDTTVVKEIEIPVDELEKYRLEKGDLVMIEGGDWDKLGRTAIWNGEIENCLHQNHVFRARIFHGGIDREWIMMFMNSIVGREYFAGASKQTTNLASINMTQLRSCPVPVPPKAEQKRIVSKVSVLLSQLDELSARLRSRQSTTDALLTALIHQILAVEP